MSVAERSSQPGTPLSGHEGALVASVSPGDDAAFEALYLAYHVPLWRFAFGYVRSRDIAEDIVQEAFLSLWSSHQASDANGQARAWLYAAVRNRALNHLRHERVVARALAAPAASSAGRIGPEAALGAMGMPQPDLHEIVEARELDEALTRALNELTERCRVAMTLRWKHGLAPMEIAAVLGSSPESVRVLLTRARKELAVLIARPRR